LLRTNSRKAAPVAGATIDPPPARATASQRLRVYTPPLLTLGHDPGKCKPLVPATCWASNLSLFPEIGPVSHFIGCAVAHSLLRGRSFPRFLRKICPGSSSSNPAAAGFR